MGKMSGLFFAALAVASFSAPADAGAGGLLALGAKPKAQEQAPAARKEPAAAQDKAAAAGYTDFDAIGTVNDPLYRAGSREMLKQEMKADSEKKDAPKQLMRDAPVSKGAVVPVKARPQLKKRRTPKPLRTDPVKVKDTI